MVIFTPNLQKIQEAQRVFAACPTLAEAQGISFPRISLEAARYPDWPGRNRWKQIFTAWEIDAQQVPHLAFGKIDKALKPGSIEPWTMNLGNGLKITIFNPVAHALCYQLRVPSGIKRKDRETLGIYNEVIARPYSKISLVNDLADLTTQAGLRRGIDYNVLFQEWRDYIETISKRPDLLTKVKGKITGLYWDTNGRVVID